MEEANEFLRRYKVATSVPEKENVVAEYEMCYASLDPKQQEEAGKIMHKLRPGLRQKIDELDALMVKAKALLNVPA